MPTLTERLQEAANEYATTQYVLAGRERVRRSALIDSLAKVLIDSAINRARDGASSYCIARRTLSSDLDYFTAQELAAECTRRGIKTKYAWGRFKMEWKNPAGYVIP